VNECGITLPSHNSEAANYKQLANGSYEITGVNPNKGGVYDNYVAYNTANANGTGGYKSNAAGSGAGILTALRETARQDVAKPRRLSRELPVPRPSARFPVRLSRELPVPRPSARFPVPRPSARFPVPRPSASGVPGTTGGHHRAAGV
jgi:hypothetical protein